MKSGSSAKWPLVIVGVMVADAIVIRMVAQGETFEFSVTSGSEEIVVDLGRLSNINVYNVTLDIVNTSGAPFQVARVISSCSCTEAELSESTLDRDPVKLVVSIDTGGKVGTLGERVSLVEAEPGSRLVTFLINAQLPDDDYIYASPKLLQFVRRVVEGDRIVRRVSVQRKNKKPIIIRSVRVDVPWATARQLMLGEVLQTDIDTFSPVIEVAFDAIAHRTSSRVTGMIIVDTDRGEVIRIPLRPHESERAAADDG